ncbi:type IV secretion system DNA-binding domain-containing protein [Candidatus Gracilibacteria bacterium]|nr:type IV secretion system DNA-binding domain-containing protein [Candidatus Gracilibacteria bacterium]
MSVSTPNIAWVRSRKLEPPHDLPVPVDENDTELTILGMTNFRSMRSTFGMKSVDRRRHTYIIGKTGMGKSTLLENMIYSDIQAGKGVAVVDPHGDLAEHVMDFVPSHRTNDVIMIDPSDRDFPIGFNMLENVDPAYATIVASGLVGIFKKLYAESWGPRLEHILRNTILGLLEYPNTTMLGITRILQDQDYRRRVVKKITDPIVKAFWIQEFERMDPKMRVEAISPILNKVGQFLASPLIRNIVGQPKSSVNFRFAMDKKKIIIVNLSKGKIGEDVSSLLGAMIITKFQLDAMSRANIPEPERNDFYLYVDEFQNFATESFATILSEARKYRLNLIMANQYIAQMDETVRDAVFGNVGSLVSFQVGFDDAEAIAGQFGGDETMIADLVALSMGNTYLRLLVNGMPSTTFSMSTFPPIERDVEDGRREKILKFCRERYSMKRELIEDKIRRWSESSEEKDEPGRE